MMTLEVGDIVRISAPGSRETNGESRLVPALVLGQYQDGSLALYCLHFQGSPLLANGVRQDVVEVVFSRREMERRIKYLEDQVVALGGKKREDPRFALAE